MAIEISNWTFFGSIGILVATIALLIWNTSRMRKKPNPQQQAPMQHHQELTHVQQMEQMINQNGMGTPPQEQQPPVLPPPKPEPDHNKYPMPPPDDLPEIQEEQVSKELPEEDSELPKAHYGEVTGFDRNKEEGTITYFVKMKSQKADLHMGQCAVIQDD